MSNAKIGAKLSACYGPYFPAHIETLQDAYAKWVQLTGLDTSVLVLAARRLSEFRNPGTLAGEDGYMWARCLHFSIFRGKVFAGIGIIAFPHCKDGELRDGTVTDRSIAFYASSAQITEAELGALAVRFLDAFTAETSGAIAVPKPRSRHSDELEVH